jgi:hypothetical protein
MNDEALDAAWTTLEPAADRRRRIDAQVASWLDAHDTSLASEWLALFKLAPLPAFGLATVSALAIAVAPPLIWFAQALM